MIFFSIFLIVSNFNREIFTSGMNTTIPNNNQNKTLKATQLFELIVSPDKIPLSEEERNNLVIEISTRLINGTHNISTTKIKQFAPNKIVEEDDIYKIPDFGLDARSKPKTVNKEIIDEENTDNDTIRGQNEEDIIPSTRMGGQNEDTKTGNEKKLNGEKVKNNETIIGGKNKVTTEAVSARIGDPNVEDLIAQKKKGHIMEEDILENTTIGNSNNDTRASNLGAKNKEASDKPLTNDEDFLAKEKVHNTKDTKTDQNKYDMSLEEDILEDTTIGKSTNDMRASNVGAENKEAYSDKPFIHIKNPYDFFANEKAHDTEDAKNEENENDMRLEEDILEDTTIGTNIIDMRASNVAEENNEEASDKPFIRIGNPYEDNIHKEKVHNTEDTKTDKNGNNMRSDGISKENKEKTGDELAIGSSNNDTLIAKERTHDLVSSGTDEGKFKDPKADKNENDMRSAGIGGENKGESSEKPSIKNETDMKSTSISIENKVKAHDELLTRIRDLIAKQRAQDMVSSDAPASSRTGVDKSDDAKANATRSASIGEGSNKKTNDKPFPLIKNETDIGSTSTSIKNKVKTKDEPLTRIGDLIAKERAHDVVPSDNLTSPRTAVDRSENDTRSVSIDKENKKEASGKPSTLIKNETDMRSSSISIEDKVKATNEPLTRIGDLIAKERAHDIVSSDNLTSPRTGVDKPNGTKTNDTRSASIDKENKNETSDKPSTLIQNETDIRSTNITNDSKQETTTEPLTRLGDLIAKERTHDMISSDDLVSSRTGVDKSNGTKANDTRSASINEEIKNETSDKPSTVIKNETEMRSTSIDDKVKTTNELLSRIGDLIAKERAYDMVPSDDLVSSRADVDKSDDTKANDTRLASIEEENKNETSNKSFTLIKNETNMRSSNITNAIKQETTTQPLTRIGDLIAKERAYDMVPSDDLVSPRTGVDKSDDTKANDTRSASIDEKNREDTISNKNTSNVATSRISDLITEVRADDQVSTRTGEDKFDSVKDNNTRSSSIDKENKEVKSKDEKKVDQPKIEGDMRSAPILGKNQSTSDKISTRMGKMNKMKDKMASPSKGKDKSERTQAKNDMRSPGIIKKNKEDIAPNGEISDAVTARIRDKFVAENANDGVLSYTGEKVQNKGNKNNMRSEDVQPEDTQPEEKQPEDIQPEDRQPEDKQPEDKQPEDIQLEDKQPEDIQPEDKQTKDIQPEDRQPEDKQPEDIQPEDKQPEDIQPKDKQTKDIPPEDRQPEDKQPEDIQPEDKQPEDKQPEDIQPEDKQTKDIQPEERQPEDKQPEDKQPEDIQPEDKQPEDKQPEDIQPEDKQTKDIQTKDRQPEDKQPEDIQSEDKEPEDKQTEDIQPEDKKTKDIPPEDRQPEDKQPEDIQPEDKQPEDKQPEDIQPEDKQTKDIQLEDRQPVDKQPEDIQPKDKQPEDIQPEDNQPKNKKSEDIQPNKEKPENAMDDRLTTYPSEVIDPFRYEFKCVSIISKETNMYIGKAILKRNSTKNVSAKKHPNFWISKWDIEYRGDTGSIKVPFLPFYWRSTATYDPMDFGPHNIIVEFDDTRNKQTNFKIEAQQKQTFKIINNDNCAFVDEDLNVKMDENCDKNNSLFYISKASTEPCSILKGVNIRCAKSNYFMTVTKAAENMEVISVKKDTDTDTSQWDIYNYPEYSLIRSSIDSRFIWSQELDCVKPGPIKIKTATNPLKESNKFRLDINFLNDDFYLGVTTLKVCENYVISDGLNNVILSTDKSPAVPNFFIAHPDNENHIIMQDICIRVKSNDYYLGFHHSGKLEPYITLRVIPTKEMWTKWTISRRNGLYQIYALYNERKFYWRHWQQKGKIISWEAATEETYFQLDSLTEGTIGIYEYCLYVQSLVVLSRNEYCDNREDEIFYFSNV